MLVKDYAQFDLADLVADEDFVSWVLSPDPKKDAYWSEMIESNPDIATRVAEAKLLVLLMQSRNLAMPERRNEQLWDRIKVSTIEKTEARKNSRFTISVFWKVAAVLLIAIMATFGVMYNNTFSDRETVATRKGEKTVIHLEDGSEVWLNADSKLVHPNSFDDEASRIVELEGEAFFDIAENPNKPFIVRAHGVEVKVLGTAFNIRSWNEKETRTTLVRGKVQLQGPGASEDDQVILTPDQQATYHAVSGKITVVNVDAEGVAGWKDGRLKFDNATIAEMENELERWYNVEIQLEDPASGSCRFSTTLDNEPITRLLEMLKASSGIEYSIDGKKISIKGKLCSQKTE